MEGWNGDFTCRCASGNDLVPCRTALTLTPPLWFASHGTESTKRPTHPPADAEALDSIKHQSREIPTILKRVVVSLHFQQVIIQRARTPISAPLLASVHQVFLVTEKMIWNCCGDRNDPNRYDSFTIRFYCFCETCLAELRSKFGKFLILFKMVHPIPFDIQSLGIKTYFDFIFYSHWVAVHT